MMELFSSMERPKYGKYIKINIKNGILMGTQHNKRKTLFKEYGKKVVERYANGDK